jgi:hypothetical protein
VILAGSLSFLGAGVPFHYQTPPGLPNQNPNLGKFWRDLQWKFLVATAARYWYLPLADLVLKIPQVEHRVAIFF